MNRTLVALTAIAVAVFLVAIFAGAQTIFDGNVESTGTLTGTTITASTGFTGDVTGDVTGSAAGALGNFTVVEADTLKPGSGTAFNLRAKDGHNDAVLNCATFTGNLTGDVTGAVFQSATYKGNLPTTSSGEETGEFFMNATGDSGWVADNNSWVQLWP